MNLKCQKSAICLPGNKRLSSSRRPLVSPPLQIEEAATLYRTLNLHVRICSKCAGHAKWGQSGTVSCLAAGAVVAPARGETHV
jgi:hypothetical protein